MNTNFNLSGPPEKNILARIVGILLSAVALGLALMFSAVFFVVLAFVALALWGYFWWKTRALRRAMQEQMEQMKNSQDFEQAPRRAPEDADIIDGEAVRVDDDRNNKPG